MAILPLHKLFTTKEDRLAVFRAIRFGGKKKSVPVFINAFARTYDPVPKDASTTNFNYNEKIKTTSATYTDKMAELSKKSGVNLLTLKQMYFFNLIPKVQGVDLDAKPFACTTVEEIDTLGKRVFGSLWCCENGGDAGLEIDYSDCTGTNKLLEERKLLNIAHPYVYPEQLPPQGNFSNLGACTLLACLACGSVLCDDLQGFDLKAYLNDKLEDEYSWHKPLMVKLERLFYLTLFVTRVGAMETNRYITSDLLDKKRLDTILCSSWFPAYIKKWNYWDIYEQALLIASDLRPPYADTNGKTQYCYVPWSDNSTLVGTDEEKIFFIREIWYRYLQNNWTNMITSFPFKYKTEPTYWNRNGEQHKLYVFADMDYYPDFADEDMEREGIEEEDRASRKRSFYRYIIPLDDIRDDSDEVEGVPDFPAGNKKEKYTDALIYTSNLLQYTYKRERRVSNTERIRCKRSPKVLITNSCYITPLREFGMEIYIAFRPDDAEEPMDFLITCEEDRKIIKACAKQAGASLSNGKNNIIMLKAKPYPAFDELTAENTLTKDEFLMETLRASFLTLMLSSSSALLSTPVYAGIGNLGWDSSTCLHKKPYNRSNEFEGLFSSVTKDGEGCALFHATPDSLKREMLDIEKVALYWKRYKTDEEGNKRFHSDSDDCIRDESPALAYNLRTEAHTKMFLECGYPENGEYCLAFPIVRALFYKMNMDDSHGFVLGANLPILYKDGYCMYVRWEEIPQLLPEIAEQWEYVDSMSEALIKVYLSAAYLVDFRRE